MIKFGPFRYDAESRFLYRGDEEIALPPRVLAVLESLLKRPGKLIAKDDILASAWDGAFVGEDSLTQAISQLRNALGDDPQRPTFIQTIPKRGYRFIAGVSEPLVSQGPVPKPTEEEPDSPRTMAPSATLAVGTVVGNYELAAQIGAGAMGEVWRARDTELQRDVAIKVVPQYLAGEAAVIERFRREALMLAAVNHPNIATIHGVEEVNGTRFIVMELLDGETLQERLGGGALPADDALNIAIQIARALEVAHDAGIVHRDLKPANIMLGAGNHVKVLDFGLAKDADSADGEATVDPTLLTASGLLVGTAAYMSPEQAAGKPIDKRSDIFSFGCVLFEMLAGQRPFAGDSASEMVAAILKDAPDWSALPDTTPADVRGLLRRCVRKNPERRIHDIADARIEIEEARAEPSHVEAAAAVVLRAGPSWRLAMSLLVLALLVGTTAGVLGTRLSTIPAVSPLTTRLTMDLEPGLRLWGGHRYEDEPWTFLRPSRTAIALSPDGKYLVYAATDGQSPQLYLRDMQHLSATPISGTEGGFNPFFSPDGERVGFFVPLDRQGTHALKVVTLGGGGRPRTVVDRIVPQVAYSAPFGASWVDDDTITYSPEESAGLLQVSANTGEPEALTDLAGLYSHRLPTVLPGSGAVVFNAEGHSGPSSTGIVVQPLRGDGSQKLLIEHGSDARFSPTGHLVYVLDGSLMAVPFDTETLDAVGDPVRVVEDVMWAAGAGNSVLNSGAGQFTLSQTGTLVYATGGATPEVPGLLAWVNRQGDAEALPLPPRDYLFPRVSPDRRYLAYAAGRTDEKQIWVYDIDRGIPTQLTFDGGSLPVWSPDSSEIVFSFGDDLYRMPVDGSGQPEPLLQSGSRMSPSSWSPQGFIAYVQDNDVWVLDLNQGTPRPFKPTPYNESHPIFSPDGRRLAYSSDRSGQREVYVAPFPDGVPEKKVSIEGGSAAVWSADGRELFYKRVRGSPARQPAGEAVPRSVHIWVADVREGDTFDFAVPRQLFEFMFDGVIGVRNFDVHPDGGRFVMVPSDHEVEPPVTKLHVVLNWFEELKRLVPTGR